MGLGKLIKNLITGKVAFDKVQLLSNNKITQKFTVNNKTVNINISKLTLGEQKRLSKAINQEFEDGSPLLEEDYQERVDDYVQKIDLTGNQKLINFYSGKIPSEDIIILKASLYLKTTLETGGDTIALKREIMQRFGIRGRNISNLCSAGYFHREIKETYNAMKKTKGFDLVKFQEIYNFIVEASPFAIFISKDMSKQQVLKEIKQRVENNKKYGFNYVNIHGIGYDNVNKIGYALKKIESETSLLRKITKTEGSIIAVRIEF